MKAAVYNRPMDISTLDVEKPEAGEHEILIKVKACGICGSDLHMYKLGLHPELLCKESGKGKIPGHEFSGDVVEVGSQVQDLQVGDRVAAVSMGGLAEYASVMVFPGFTVFKLPDDVSYEAAATLEPLANSLYATKRANPQKGEKGIVFGAGIIGLGIVQCIRALELDLEALVVVDVSDRRLAVAKELGADIIINAAKDNPYEKVVDLFGKIPLMLYPSEIAGTINIAWDCVGYIKDRPEPPVLQQAIEMMAERTGRIVVHGLFEDSVPLNLESLVLKQVDILGSFGFTSPEITQALDFIRTKKVDRGRLISHTFTLDQAKEAFDMQCNTGESIKVMVKP